MAKLTDLINDYTVTLQSEKVGLSADEVATYGSGAHKWKITLTTRTGRIFEGEMFYPKTHVIKPSDNKYHSRYGADITQEAPGGSGVIMDNEWWYRFGRAIRPRLDEVTLKYGDLCFFMQGVASFEEYAALRGLNPDSLKAFRQYERDQETILQLKTFLDDAYDLFVGAELDF